MAERPIEHKSAQEWAEIVNYDFDHEKRRRFLDEVALADQLITNNIDMGNDEIDWYKRATYVKMLQYLTGKLAYSVLEPKVIGTEDADLDVAEMYRAGLVWELTRPRGLHQKIGRQQIRYDLEDWINYGLGAHNTYFDSRVRDRENWTGSIINESAPARSIILDSSVDRLADIGHLAWMFDMPLAKLSASFPQYSGSVPELGESVKNVKLWEIQYRAFRPITAKVSNRNVIDALGADKYYWEDEKEFKAAYLDRITDGDVKTRNRAAQQLWNEMADDLVLNPQAYNRVFLSSGKDEDGKLKIVAELQPPKYLGKDFTITLIPFLLQPKTPYPSGAAKFVYDDIRMSILIATLFKEMMQRANNSGKMVNVDYIVGDTDVEKVQEAKKFMENVAYPLLIRGAQSPDQVVGQTRAIPPNNAMMEFGDRLDFEAKDFFNMHESQMGMPAFSGMPARLNESLLASGSFPLVHMIDSISWFMSGIFRKTAQLIHDFMPPEKRIALSDLPGNIETTIISRERLQKYDPNVLDFSIELNVDSDNEKSRKAMEALEYFKLGIVSPEYVLKKSGVRNIQKELEKVSMYKTGMQLAQFAEQDPEFAEMVNEYIKIKALEQQRGKNASGRV